MAHAAGSLEEVLRSAGLQVAPLRSRPELVGCVHVAHEQRSIEVEESRGMARFDLSLPDPPSRFGRRRGLLNLLRATFAAPYLRALLRRTGFFALRAEVPVEDLTPPLAKDLVSNLKLFANMTGADLAREQAWGGRIAQCTEPQPDGFSVDVEEARRAIVGLLRSEQLPITREPDGAVSTDMVKSNQLTISATRRAFEIVGWTPRPRGSWPGNKEKLSLLLRVNEVSSLVKVGLDEIDDVVLLFQVPRLTANLLVHADREFDAAAFAVAAIHAGKYRPDPLNDK